MELVKGYQTWLNKSLLKERKVDSRDDETDRGHAADSVPHEELAHHETRGPRTWLVYSRRGNKGKSG